MYNLSGKKLAVVGSRSCKDKQIVFDFLDKNTANIKYIISGGADGPDEFSRAYCQEHGLPILIFYPEWYDKTGAFVKSAGFQRNQYIVDEADVVVAFWDGLSKGTAHSISIAKKQGKKVIIKTF
jgi:predicted Rossmann fold nucleotide-binding protein DprA/Smf involved in DNA uptake